MSALLLLVIIVAIVWALNAQGTRFLPHFSTVLEAPRIERGAFSILSGRSSLRGRFQDRDVAIQLQLKRGRHGLGDLVVAMRTSGEQSLNREGIESRVRDEAGRRAMSALAAHDLLLSVADGWLQAWWRPQGLVFFPGRFAEEKWRPVLEAMHVLATSIERPA